MAFKQTDLKRLQFTSDDNVSSITLQQEEDTTWVASLSVSVQCPTAAEAIAAINLATASLPALVANTDAAEALAAIAATESPVKS